MRLHRKERILSEDCGINSHPSSQPTSLLIIIWPSFFSFNLFLLCLFVSKSVNLSLSLSLSRLVLVLENPEGHSKTCAFRGSLSLWWENYTGRISKKLLLPITAITWFLFCQVRSAVAKKTSYRSSLIRISLKLLL